MKNDWSFFLSEIYAYGLKVSNAAEDDIISSKLREPWFFRFSLIHLPSCPPAISHLLLINFQLIFCHLLQHLLRGQIEEWKNDHETDRLLSFFWILLLFPPLISRCVIYSSSLACLGGLDVPSALKPPLKFNSTFKPQRGATYQQEERDFCFFICLGGSLPFHVQSVWSVGTVNRRHNRSKKVLL